MNGEWSAARNAGRLVRGTIKHTVSGGLSTLARNGRRVAGIAAAVALAAVLALSAAANMVQMGVYLIAMSVLQTAPEFGEIGEDFHADPSLDPVDPSDEGNYLIAQLTGGVGRISQGFHGSGTGAGVDIAADKGTPVVALFDGTVSYYHWMDENGALASLGAVAFLKTGTTTAIYAHLSGFDTAESMELIGAMGSVQVFSPTVREFRYSREIHKGEVLGYIGDTGYSFGYHLHFGLMVDGRVVNPLTVEDVE